MPQDYRYSYDSNNDYDYDSKYTIESIDYSQHSVSITTENINERDSFSYPRPNDPSKSVSLSWKNLSYQITDPKTKEEKKIIQDVIGYVRPGEVLAIMGPSGAGKSTFLDLLAGRKDPKHVSGEIFLNGKPGNVEYVSTYVMKDDALMGTLTVRENLQFATDLCFPTSYSRLKKNAHVQNIITEFGLEKVADSKIGTVFVRGISKEEKRRCAIASQVLTLPKIIFLNEPTSGLDSAAAFNVMNTIADMAKKYYLTVITSIHQPSTETYSLFDKLLLLGHGKTLYFGDREKALTYFEKLDYACPPYNNPADHYLKLVNSDFMEEAEQNITTFSDSFSKSHYKVDIDKQINEIIEKSSDNNDQITEKTRKRYARGFLEQTFTLMKRSHKNTMRNRLFWTRVAIYMCLALLMGTAWWQVGNHQKNVQDRLSAHFVSVAFLAFMSVAGIPGFLEERLVFQRERSNGFYSVGSYVLASTLASIPFVNIIAGSFSIIAYPMIGLHGGFFNFMNFFTSLSLGLFVAESMAVFISATIPIFVAALAINVIANGFFMVVEGYFVRRDAIPKILKLAHYSDYQKYMFEAIIKNDLEGLTFDCDRDPNVLGNCNCIYGGKNSTFTCQSSGQDVLNYFGYTEIEFFKWTFALFAFSLAFRVGFYLILRFRKGRH